MSASKSESGATYHAQLEASRRRILAAALEQTNGNRTHAARRLGLSRESFQRMLRKLSPGAAAGPSSRDRRSPFFAGPDRKPGTAGAWLAQDRKFRGGALG